MGPTMESNHARSYVPWSKEDMLRSRTEGESLWDATRREANKLGDGASERLA